MRLFKVVFINGVCRERLSITIDETFSLEQIRVLLDKEVVERGYNLSGSEHVLVRLKNGEIIPIEKSDLFSDDVDYIIYSCIVHTENAFGFAAVDDIAFDFRTREQNHRSYPHVHAFHDGQEISINLRNGKVEGSFKNSRKQRLAAEFVSENLRYFLEGWRLMIEEGRTSSLKELKQDGIG